MSDQAPAMTAQTVLDRAVESMQRCPQLEYLFCVDTPDTVHMQSPLEALYTFIMRQKAVPYATRTQTYDAAVMHLIHQQGLAPHQWYDLTCIEFLDWLSSTILPELPRDTSDCDSARPMMTPAQQRIAAAQQRRAARRAHGQKDPVTAEAPQCAAAIQAFQCQLRGWLGADYDGFVADFGCAIKTYGTAMVWLAWVYEGVPMQLSVLEQRGVPFLSLHVGDDPRTSHTHDIFVSGGGVHDALVCAIPMVWHIMNPSSTKEVTP